MTIEDKIWLAGFIDGEGYIGVIKKSNRFQAQIRIGTTHKLTMEYVAQLFGSPLNVWNESHKKWKSCYTTCIYDKKAEQLAKELLPYLKTKKEQAKNLIDFRSTVEYGRNQFSSPRSINQSIYYLKSKELNKRGK